MIKIILSVVICGLFAVLAKIFNLGLIRNQKKFNFTILLAVITVVIFFIGEKQFGMVLISYGLGIVMIGICLAILVVIRQNSHSVATVEVDLDEKEHTTLAGAEMGEILSEELSQDTSEVDSKPKPELEEDGVSFSEEETSANHSSEQEAIDELIKQFFKHNEEQQPVKEELLEQDQSVEDNQPVLAAPVIEETTSEVPCAGTDPEDVLLQELSVAASLAFSDNKNEEQINSSEIITEELPFNSIAPEPIDAQPKDNEEILFNNSWRHVLASLEETAAAEIDREPAVWENQDDLLVSNLSALLKDELGDNAEKLIAPSPPKMSAEVPAKAPLEETPEAASEAKPKTPLIYQAPVHKNRLENEKPSSIVLKMEELIVVDTPNPSSSNEGEKDRQSSYLFELEELLDPNDKK